MTTHDDEEEAGEYESKPPRLVLLRDFDKNAVNIILITITITIVIMY